MVGAQNIIQSLKTLDPAMLVLENKQWGSDPNRMPKIEIRGKTSVVGLQTEFENDPNQPLFILDGVETTLETIINLNMDRVASVTILKDAASTAIYGSKAANGVIVRGNEITGVRPVTAVIQWELRDLVRRFVGLQFNERFRKTGIRVISRALFSHGRNMTVLLINFRKCRIIIPG